MSVFELASQQKRVVMSTDEMDLVHPHWSSDQRSLLVLYAAKSSGLSRRQIGAISYPAGVFRTITNDTNNYVGLRLSASTSSLVSVVSKTTSSIEVVSGTGESPGAATRVVQLREPIRGFTWTDDGDILFPQGNQLSIRTIDGRERPVFVSDVNSPPANPDVCPGTGHIVFVLPFRDRSNTRNVWRINADGSELRQLTDLPHAAAPAGSPDGQWVAFHTSTGISRVRTSGGPVEVVDPTVAIGNMAWSPDSAKIVTMTAAPTKGGTLARTRVLITLGASTRRLDVPADATGAVRFTPDGSGIAFRVRRDGTDSIHVLPLDGSTPRVLTSFSGSMFRWSPDGSKLAGTRDRVDSDVVLLRDPGAERR